MRFIWTLYHLVALKFFSAAQRQIQPTDPGVIVVIRRWHHHNERLRFWWSFA